MFATSAVRNLSSEWLEYLKPRTGARIRLLCFPYAGGSALTYRDWQSELPDFIEVWPVQLPARGRRISEPPFHRIRDVTAALEGALLDLLDMPYALFGYSMGALIAFEFARRASVAGVPPRHLFVAARGAPHLNGGAKSYSLPDHQFIAELRRIQATPEEILNDVDLVHFFLPTIRADFEVAQTYEFDEGSPVQCPITVFGGITDAEVPPEDMDPWRIHTLGQCKLNLFPGGHFFLNESRHAILSAIGRDLRHHGASPRNAAKDVAQPTGSHTARQCHGAETHP